MTAGAGVLGSQHEGAGALAPDGAWMLFDASGAACDCCLCAGNVAGLLSEFTEDFSGDWNPITTDILSPEWVSVNPPAGSSFQAYETFEPVAEIFTAWNSTGLPGRTSSAFIRRLTAKQFQNLLGIYSRCDMSFDRGGIDSGSSSLFIDMYSGGNVVVTLVRNYTTGGGSSLVLSIKVGLGVAATFLVNALTIASTDGVSVEWTYTFDGTTGNHDFYINGEHYTKTETPIAEAIPNLGCFGAWRGFVQGALLVTTKIDNVEYSITSQAAPWV